MPTISQPERDRPRGPELDPRARRRRGTEDDPAAADLDVGDDELEDGGEDVGLDTDAGVDDDGDDDIDALDEADDDDWDAPSEASDSDEIDGGDDEGGWTADSDASQVEGWDSDLTEDEQEGSSQGDAGDEGVEDRYEPTGDDDDFVRDNAQVERPQRDNEDGEAEVDLGDERSIDTDEPETNNSSLGEEELAADLDLDDDDEFDNDAPEDDARALPAFAARPVDVRAETTWLGPHGEAIVFLGPEFAVGRSLYRVGKDQLDRLAYEAGEEESTSLVRDATGALWIGLGLGGLAKSVDDGATFERVPGPASHAQSETGAYHVHAERHANGVRLWVRTRGGALFRSDDDGRTWSEPVVAGVVRAFSVVDGGGVVGLVTVRNARSTRVVRSSDGGRSWRSLSGPEVDGASREVRIAAAGDVVVVSVETTTQNAIAPQLTTDDGQHWRALPDLRGAGAVVLVGGSDRARATLYAAVYQESVDRGCILRVDVGGDETARLVIDLGTLRTARPVDPALPAQKAKVGEGDQRVYELVASDGAVIAGTGEGALRIRIS